VPLVVELILLYGLRGLSHSEVLCEPIHVLQVALRAIVPCLIVTLLYLPPTLLEELFFLVLHYCPILAYLYVPVPKLV
jgi:hypothetical protein